MSDLADAIRRDDVDAARAILRDHPELAASLDEPLAGESFGGLAIGAATRNHSTNMLELLIEHGADINARTDWWAGGFGVLETCDLKFAHELITLGAKVDACAAARLGDIARLKKLLDEDPAHARSRGGDGKTPLHYAASAEVARLLLAAGADIDALDVDHESTPAQYLVSDEPDVARFLITRGCRTDILLASALGATELVRRILDEDPDTVRTRVSDEWFPKRDPRAGGTIYMWTLGGMKSAYIVAREKHHDDVANLISERAAPAQMMADLCLVGDAEGARKVRQQHPEIVAQLGPNEKALLSSAVFDANAGAVRLMLECGWPVSAPNAQGMTALHAAAWHGHAKLVEELLAAGAEVNSRERQYGGTPLDWARHGVQNSWRRDGGDYASVMEQIQRAGGTQSS